MLAFDPNDLEKIADPYPLLAEIRRGGTPISFAFGAHFCLGASLARSEAEVMLASVAARWHDLRLHSSHGLKWHQRGPFRGLDVLMVSCAT